MSLADHQRMVGDRLRVEAYRAAIQAAIRPGDVVVDIGTGTGLLAVFAAQAGARQVYAIERSSMHAVARQVASANQVADRITVLHGDSHQITLPEPADWIVCELMGSFGLDENLLGILQDAKRWLKPNGRILPQGLTIHVAPAMAPQTYDLLSFWETADLGVDLRPVAQAAKTDLQRADPTDLRVLAEPQTAWSIDPLHVDTLAPHTKLTFSVQTPGQCHGFATWFEAALAPGISLRTGPTDPPTHWGCGFLPMDHLLDVTVGDRLELELQLTTVAGSVAWSWRWQWHGDSGGTAAGSGGNDDIWQWLADHSQTAAPHDRLEITPDGYMTMAVLNACRDGRTESEIVQILIAQGGVFADAVGTRRWVRKVLSRYSRPLPP